MRAPHRRREVGPIAVEGLPLRAGDRGEAIRDLQRRLAAVGIPGAIADAGTYGPDTSEAVRRFQEERGLHVDGICGRETWSSLVEAGYRLGDRLLYHRSPMLRGDDVTELQRRLGALGFDAGRVDGIFGPQGASALEEFQRNVGLTADGVCGPATIAAIGRLGGRTADVTGVAGVREREALRCAPRSLAGHRIAIGESGGLAALVAALARHLQEAGAVTAVLHHPDGSHQAAEANDFGAQVYLGVRLATAPACVACYFAAPGFESSGGRRLAQLSVEALTEPPPGPPGPLSAEGAVRGMRRPVLRETRMPAVVCELGPPESIVSEGAEVAAALAAALARWVASPLDPDDRDR